MKDIKEFINEYYESGTKLVDDFNVTTEKSWDVLVNLNELYVQIGQVYNISISQDYINDPNRHFDNLGDEISDIMLQFMNLARLLHIDLREIGQIKDTNIDDFNVVPILVGQMSEILMEQNGYRFKKDRKNYNNSIDFIKERLFKAIIIVYNFAKKSGLDISKEFKEMLDDANNFLAHFDKDPKARNEYIDIYDENENRIGYSSKDNAHKLGYWHKTFNAIFVNPKTNKVYFQLKNHKHNKSSNEDTLVLTVGGHLKSGETLEDGIREIKEETGIDVAFNNLIKIDKRKIEKAISKNYIIKEFQYYYLYKSDKIHLSDFKPVDDEVCGFIELDINSVISIFENDVITYGKLNINGKNKMIKVSKDSFDKEYVKEDLFLSLLNVIKKQLKTNKINLFKHAKMNKQIKKLYRVSKVESKLLGNLYYFEDGNIQNSFDLNKENISYSVLLIDFETKDNRYMAHLIIKYKNHPIPYILLKTFTDEDPALKYFDSLCDFIKYSNNNEIINRCYLEKILNIQENIIYQ